LGSEAVTESVAPLQVHPNAERERLAEDLPLILPELHGDLVWRRIIDDARPRPALSSLGDQIEAQFKAEPNRFPEIKDSDFNQRP
jgi:hypothetical protein